MVAIVMYRGKMYMYFCAKNCELISQFYEEMFFTVTHFI